jgi:hypothetical protein
MKRGLPLQRAAIVAALVLACAASAAQQPDDADISAHVRKDGEWVIVDVDFSVQATASEAWAVMTDYDNMASFISNLQSSRIVSREGDTLIVMQKGSASRGLLSISFENTREIVLTPISEIRSRLISGDLKESAFTTRVVDHGDSSQIVNHGEFIPKLWVPPVIGPALIEAETRKQFQQLRAEIMRRKTGRGTTH